MLCLACVEPSLNAVCGQCRGSFRSPPDALVGGVVVRSALVHEGAAKRLVHRLKYQGTRSAAGELAALMVDRLPVDARCVVPVPRSLVRRLKYGVDPGRELARALGERVGLPVLDALAAELWHRPNAGRGRGARREPRFRSSVAPPQGVVLVDDVLTTGSTISSALEVLGPGVIGGVTATRALRQ